MLNFFSKNKKEPKNLKDVVAQLKGLENDLEKISRELESLKNESRFFVQKVGLIRFNPFSEVGGDQSFSIALLDSHNSGMVITSLYTREGNRVYAKPVKKGESEYLLSDEEKQAIAQANKVNAEQKVKAQASHANAEHEMKTKFSVKNDKRNSKPNNSTSDSGRSGSY